MASRSKPNLALRYAAAFFLYVFISWLSLEIQADSRMTTQIWPAAGLARALVLLWGPQVAPIDAPAPA